MDDKELYGIDDSTISEDIDVIPQEQPIEQPLQQNPPKKLNKPNNNPFNTISNSVNSFKSGYQKSKDLANKVQGLRNRPNQLPTNSKNNEAVSSDGASDSVNGGAAAGAAAAGAQEKIKAVKDKVENKVAGKAIQAMSGGMISSTNAEKLATKAKVLMNKKAKMRAYIAIGVSIGILIFIIVASVLMDSDDRSLTSLRTNDYMYDQLTDEQIIEYMSFIAICPSVNEAREKALEYGVELGEDEMVTFETMRQLAEVMDGDVAQTCLNAIDYYDPFKDEYMENKKPCKRGEEILPNFWIKGTKESFFPTNPKAIEYFIGQEKRNEYDCQIFLPTQLMFETMSYDLTDQDLFNKDYLDRDDYVEYEEDLRKLADALSEFIHETCYKWMYRDAEGVLHYEACSGCKKEKVPHDGYYFQVSFDKYVCYLKYGDSCGHPNYWEERQPREKFPDMVYENHLCVGPENDRLEAVGGSSGSGVTYTKPEEEQAPNEELLTGDGEEIAEYAQQFIGNPYVSGGTSLTEGADCSGFVKAVYEKFGISLPHSSYELRSKGQAVASLSDAKPGDLICYEGHVAIYIGNNKIVHASTQNSGIKISDDAGYRKIVAIRRIVE